jgi:hypothetical protein
MGHGTSPKCGGTNRQGGPCGNPAGKNTDHFGSGNCANHGGATPTGRIAALNEQAQRLLYRHDAGPVTDPLEALQRLAGRALAIEETFGQLVNDLTEIRYDSEGGGEQLRAEVAVLERAMDRCGKLLVDIARLNIDERLARVTERQAEQVSAALSAVLGEMGLTVDQQREARTGVARHLRAV